MHAGNLSNIVQFNCSDYSVWKFGRIWMCCEQILEYKGHCTAWVPTFSNVFFCCFSFSHVPIKIATDAKTENRTWSECFSDGRKFRRQWVNVIDTTWGRIYFSTCKNFERKFRTQCAMTFWQTKQLSLATCLEYLCSVHTQKSNWLYLKLFV